MAIALAMKLWGRASKRSSTRVPPPGALSNRTAPPDCCRKP